jgi:hypothetical protein
MQLEPTRDVGKLDIMLAEPEIAWQMTVLFPTYRIRTPPGRFIGPC